MEQITMPSMGADMEEGTIVKWLKREGDFVKRGDKIAEIETDKTVVEMESYQSGTLRKILFEEGSLVSVGKTIALIGNPDEPLEENSYSDDADSESAEDASDERKLNEGEYFKSEVQTGSSVNTESDAFSLAYVGRVEEEKPTSQTDTSSEEVPSAIPDAESLPGAGHTMHIKASPVARTLAREMNINLSEVTGTGPGGRILRDDVLSFKPSTAQSSPPNGTVEARKNIRLDDSSVPLSKIRQAIARVTVRSKTETPHFYVTKSVDMTAAVDMRIMQNAILSDTGDRISVNDMVLKATVNALLKYPKWNSFYKDYAIQGNADINLGVAIALDEGLIVPAIMHAQNMSLVELSRAAKDIGRRAKSNEGSLSQDELTGGTFSTSNLGMFGTDSFSAIIVPPQSMILAVGAAKAMPVVKGGDIVVRQMMNLTVSADHRVGDGAEAALFLNEVQKNLENPLRLLV